MSLNGKKCVPSVINNIKKITNRKKFYFDGFLGPIKFDSPNGRGGGDIQFVILKKRELSL